jgi:hypothetical protein
VDDELEAALRAAREGPEDIRPALKLASIAERLGNFPVAWTAIMRHVRPTEDDSTALAAVRGLASRNPAAAVAYLRGEDEELARFSCGTLARAKELLPLVVLACEQRDDARCVHARIALRTAVAPGFPGLVGIDPLALRLGSDSRRVDRFLRLYARIYGSYSAEVVLGELWGQISPPSMPPAVASFLPPPFEHIPTDLGLNLRFEGSEEIAREVVSRALSRKQLELLPWLSGLAGARDRKLASEAVAAFQELTGRLAPPLDPEDLSRRWVR